MSATFTKEGAIPHLRVETPHGAILAPVKLETEPDGKGGRKIIVGHEGSADKRLPTPVRRDGRLVFALPGGGEVLG